MARLIFVPQMPVKMRYPEWWYHEIPNRLKNLGGFDDVITLGKLSIKIRLNQAGRNLIQKESPEQFSPALYSACYESSLIDEWLDFELKEDDVLFLADLSFPGLFPQILYHKRPKKCFAFCHATALNNYDYYDKDKNSKFAVETGISQLFDGIFVGSNYHKEKLECWGWENVYVTRVPIPSLNIFKSSEKKRDFICVSRPTEQKVTPELEKLVEDTFHTKIERPDCRFWDEYYKYISESKFMLITAKEETFGYQVVDALLNNCIPLAPNKFSYPELLDEEFLYDDGEELISRINMWNHTMDLEPDTNITIYRLKCMVEVNAFYRRIEAAMTKK